MVDFRKLRLQKLENEPTEPYEIFKRLGTDEIDDLWHSQQTILEEWDKRRKERDLVIKLNTGGGKTIIGLLIAKSIVNETNGSVLYLCPTVQLVNQTIEKAKLYRISAIEYVSGQGIPIGFRSGKCIMVATYSALFNGKTVFGLEGALETIKVDGIIFDDAHTAEGIVRNQFTLSISSSEHEEIYNYIVGLFRKTFEDIGRIALFDDIVDGKDSKVLEVPYWSWISNESVVREILKENSEKFKYTWAFLRDELKKCHCLITRKEIIITPMYPLVNMISTFNNCSKRIYMSATLADDSTIVRTFNADYKSVSKPIFVEGTKSMGERMMIAPGLMSFMNKDTEEIKLTIKELAKNVSNRYGVIILTPSEYKANDWTEVGEYAKESKDVLRQVNDMVNNDAKGPFVWANRYDGIDLPKDSCRLLIISGKPGVLGTYDRYIASTLGGSQLVNSLIAQRIEQGLGRATRGAGDYCVIIFEGNDIITWISEKENLKLLTKASQAQLNLGNEISKQIEDRKDIVATMLKCYNRDRDWIEYHAEELASITNEKSDESKMIEIAGLERSFFEELLNGNYKVAIEELNKAIEIANDVKLEGWLNQLMANMYCQSGQSDIAVAIQKNAYKLNKQLIKSTEEISYEQISIKTKQTEKILINLNKFNYKKGIMSKIEESLAKLNKNATANQFEDALEKIGDMIGFETERPEHIYGKGPDVLWNIGSNNYYIIECKSKKMLKNPLNKKENGQLLDSYEWFKENYPTSEGIKVLIHPSNEVTENTHSKETLLFDLKMLEQFKSNVKGFYSELVNIDLSEEAMNINCHRLLKKWNLLGLDFTQIYLSKFKISKK